ncbi:MULTISPECIES: type II toxin-antitoxin system VapC family toxin [Mycobacterium]|uniref:Ribonuclease VapC n=2 Tax=Mycobacterium TaxID=1763 RepID=A0A3B6XG47_MYCAV|nr:MULTISPECIES: type II toxin-antitoxin system VapC family toxin [Mycobacterium]ARV85515.1 twitching motility protein PilT [Mycobacterium intracellulare subsp. chimaera]ASX03701.1 PIN domain nuclease [Mycobacterium intracellulare subsp. chimaera]AXO25968.1 PIN domain nuclease [Mycobacterium avium subsp. hominissuis]KKC05385.1 ribonuclease [Mycobacterium nebraskense]KPN46143.1 ribonuclease [Mycobacterium intracellulare subsp. chimaera]
MIIDSSAIVALIQGEDPYTEQIAAAIAADPSPVMSTANAAECLIVLTNRHGATARTVFDRLRSEINLGFQPFTLEHAIAAHRAYLHYGKGRHPAALNYGDTMAYATAKLAHEPLIAIGNDFTQTDLEFNGVIGYWPAP